MIEMDCFPCVECSEEVRPRQHAVSCDGCGRLQHRTCNTGISLAMYREAIKNKARIHYVCLSCVQCIPQLEPLVWERRGLDRAVLPLADWTHMEVEADHSISFNISTKNEPVHPMQKRPVLEALSETVIQDKEVTYTIIEGVSQRQTNLLLTSTGYSFGIKIVNKGSVIWRCTSRRRNVHCSATIKQIGDKFVPRGADHSHPSTPSNQLKKEVYAKVRKTSKENVFKPTRNIVEDVILESAQSEDFSIPKMGLLKRICNRSKAKHRPSEPKSLDSYEVNFGCLGRMAF